MTTPQSWGSPEGLAWLDTELLTVKFYSSERLVQKLQKNALETRARETTCS